MCDFIAMTWFLQKKIPVAMANQYHQLKTTHMTAGSQLATGYYIATPSVVASVHMPTWYYTLSKARSSTQ